jgi:hypothetical protein
LQQQINLIRRFFSNVQTPDSAITPFRYYTPIWAGLVLAVPLAIGRLPRAWAGGSAFLVIGLLVYSYALGRII